MKTMYDVLSERVATEKPFTDLVEKLKDLSGNGYYVEIGYDAETQKEGLAVNGLFLMPIENNDELWTLCDILSQAAENDTRITNNDESIKNYVYTILENYDGLFDLVAELYYTGTEKDEELIATTYTNYLADFKQNSVPFKENVHSHISLHKFLNEQINSK